MIDLVQGVRCNTSVRQHNVPSSAGADNENVGWLFTSYKSVGGSSATNWYGRTGNWLQPGESLGGWWILDGGAITPKQASLIDKKMDDGRADKGNVTAMTGAEPDGGNVNTAITPSCLAGGNIVYSGRGNNLSSMTYNVSTDRRSCVLHFYLGR